MAGRDSEEDLDTGIQRHVWAAAIVMSGPVLQRLPQMRF